MADDAGALLVRSGLVTAKALDSARARASKLGGTLGEHLVASGAIGDDALTEFYRSRLLVPQVNPNSLARLKTKVVEAIPGDMAVELRAVPVAFDADGNLMVAMGDPSDRHAVDELAFFTGNYIVRAVATQMQIAWCLAHYYGHVTELGQRLLTPRDDQPAKGNGEPATPAAPTPESSSPDLKVPRQRGDTARVDAARHRVLPPVTMPPPPGRPSSEVLDRGTPAPAAAEADAAAPATEAAAAPVAEAAPPATEAAPPAAEAEVTPTTPSAEAEVTTTPVAAVRTDDGVVRSPAGRSRSASGEINVPKEVKPETSDPEITISANVEEPTSPGTRMPRKRRSDPPPELAERVGEVEGKDTGPRTLSDEPRVVIDMQALDPSRPNPISASGEIPLPRTRAMSARMASAPPMIDDEPSVRVELGGEPDDAPAVIHDSMKSADSVVLEDAGGESAPILLDRPRTTPPAEVVPPAGAAETDEDTDAGDGEVVLLETHRRPRTTSERRAVRRTQLGIGIGSPDGADRAPRDTEVGGLPPGADGGSVDAILIAPEPAPADGVVTAEGAGDATIVTYAAPDDSGGHLGEDEASDPPPAVPGSAVPIAASDPATTPTTTPVPSPEPPAEPAATAPEPAAAAPEPAAAATAATPATAPAPPTEGIEPDPDEVTRPVDLEDPTRRFHPESDGRTTDVYDALAAPPPPQPARPIEHDSVDDGWGPPGTTIPPPLLGASLDDSAPVTRIPISDESSAPLMIAPQITRTTAPSGTPIDPAGLARDLEAAATSLVVIMRDMDQARGRDEVINHLISHLAETHNRAAFFTLKTGELSLFAVRAPRVADPRSRMNLDGPSTFQDVVGTRLPYRGPVVDDPSRGFLQRLLGNAPIEMLVIPLSVRDRVVGLLYADGRRRHTFDDHYAIAARAAGLALERILKTKRT